MGTQWNYTITPNRVNNLQRTTHKQFSRSP